MIFTGVCTPNAFGPSWSLLKDTLVSIPPLKQYEDIHNNNRNTILFLRNADCESGRLIFMNDVDVNQFTGLNQVKN